MEKEIKIATIVDEDGEEYELEVIKEFEYKDKKYAVLFEDYCGCDDEECECHGDSDDEECECHEDSDNDEYEDEGHIYVFEVQKGENGEDTYNEVDESLMDELISVVEKELYPTEE